MISHPESPFQGQRFSEPVELLDLFPTVLDLFPVRCFESSRLSDGCIFSSGGVV